MARPAPFCGSLEGQGVGVGAEWSWVGPLTGSAHLGWCQAAVGSGSLAAVAQPGHSAQVQPRTPAVAVKGHVHPAAGLEAPGWLLRGLPSGPGPQRSSCHSTCPCEGPHCLPIRPSPILPREAHWFRLGGGGLASTETICKGDAQHNSPPTLPAQVFPSLGPGAASPEHCGEELACVDDGASEGGPQSHEPQHSQG